MTIQVALFWVFNTVVPFTDVGTDYFTFLDLLRDGHIMWATLTFVVMWNPFLIHLGVFLFGLLQNKIYGSEFEAGQKVKDIAYHLPFVLPFKNLFTAARLGLMQFGSPAFDDSNWELVEQIQHEAGVAGMYESFTEAGPQSVVQLVVILCTGRISPAQFFSIPSSLLSLSWASSRAYFIQRGEDESDPDPDMKTILMRVFFPMLVVVVNSVLLWTLIGGLLGQYIFIGIVFCSCTVFLALYCEEKITERKINQKRIKKQLNMLASAVSQKLIPPNIFLKSPANKYFLKSPANKYLSG